MACVTGGKPSLTHFTTLQKAQGFAEMEVEIKTGRTHQIRVHLSAIGCPIVGDALYRGVPAPRVMLHAKQLEFTTPQGEKIIAQSEIPPAFGVFWQSLSRGITAKVEVDLPAED
jgi:23S rRNA-/tRNA-specific pseudouridylate synthase